MAKSNSHRCRHSIFGQIHGFRSSDVIVGFTLRSKGSLALTHLREFNAGSITSLLVIMMTKFRGKRVQCNLSWMQKECRSKREKVDFPLEIKKNAGSNRFVCSLIQCREYVPCSMLRNARNHVWANKTGWQKLARINHDGIIGEVTSFYPEIFFKFPFWIPPSLTVCVHNPRLGITETTEITWRPTTHLLHVVDLWRSQ